MSDITTADKAGPVRPVALSIEVSAGTVEVRTDATRPAAVRAEPTTPNDPVGLDLVARARLTNTGDRLAVVFPDPPASRGVSIGGVQVGNVHDGVFISNGNITIDGNDTIINGQRVGGGALRVTAIVPPGSTVEIRSRSASATVIGGRDEIHSVNFTTTSGDLRTDGAARVHATTISGDIEADEVRSAQIKTTSGDIELTRLRGDVSLSSVSGDIDAHCLVSATIQARTVSGDVKVTSEPGVRPDVRASTVSGKTRVR